MLLPDGDGDSLRHPVYICGRCADQGGSDNDSSLHDCGSGVKGDWIQDEIDGGICERGARVIR